VEAHVLREAIGRHRAEVFVILDRYCARNPRIFGSVARGDATAASDIDLLVDLDPQGGNAYLRIAGIGEELSMVLGVQVDVVTDVLLPKAVSATAHLDTVAL
jgi:uncharacterized protein